MSDDVLDKSVLFLAKRDGIDKVIATGGWRAASLTSDNIC